MEKIMVILFILITLILYVYFWNRKEQYWKFRHFDIDKLCFEYNSWQIRNGKSYLDGTLDSAYDFCRSKFPMEIPLGLWWSFKPINMKTLLTDDMKTKFETYLINNN